MDDAGILRAPGDAGSDGAGVVAAVADDVETVAPGDEVVIDPTLNWGPNEEHPLPEFDILGAPTDGTFAEQVVVPAANLARKPVRLTWPEAAAINLAGLTAWRAAVTCAAAAPGRTLLMTGAGSGVSSFVIQIAAARGARASRVTLLTEEKLERADRSARPVAPATATRSGRSEQ